MLQTNKLFQYEVKLQVSCAAATTKKGASVPKVAFVATMTEYSLLLSRSQPFAIVEISLAKIAVITIILRGHFVFFVARRIWSDWSRHELDPQGQSRVTFRERTRLSNGMLCGMIHGTLCGIIHGTLFGTNIAPCNASFLVGWNQNAGAVVLPLACHSKKATQFSSRPCCTIFQSFTPWNDYY